jgi:hypothetical protein
MLFQEFENAGSGSFTPGQPSDRLLVISGDSVGVNIRVDSGGEFNSVLSQLQADGMQVKSTAATYAMVSGIVPISKLPAIAQLATSVTPMSSPVVK